MTYVFSCRPSVKRNDHGLLGRIRNYTARQVSYYLCMGIYICRPRVSGRRLFPSLPPLELDCAAIFLSSLRMKNIYALGWRRCLCGSRLLGYDCHYGALRPPSGVCFPMYIGLGGFHHKVVHHRLLGWGCYYGKVRPTSWMIKIDVRACVLCRGVLGRRLRRRDRGHCRRVMVGAYYMSGVGFSRASDTPYSLAVLSFFAALYFRYEDVTERLSTLLKNNTRILSLLRVI